MTQHILRPAEGGDGFDLLRFVLRLAPKMQDAAGRPAGVGECLQQGAGGKVAGTGQARQAVVVGAGQRTQHAGEIARGAVAGRSIRFEHGDLPAGAGQPMGGGAAGNAGADDQRAAFGGRRVAGRPAGTETAVQHLALAGETGAFFEIELDRCERFTQMPGDRPGGQRRTGGGEARQGAADFRRP